MTNKILQDFFGNAANIAGENISFNVNDILYELGGFEATVPDASELTPEQIVTALLAFWSVNNYKDSQTDARLSTDRTVPLASGSETIRRSLITREGEIQVKHDVSFSFYTVDNSEFDPGSLIGRQEPGGAPDRPQ